MSDSAPSVCDVTVIGGGLAGKAAALHLARAGLRVICIEPAEAIRQSVGESLDWSAPALLNSLGLPMEKLVSAQMATWKRHVTIKMRDGCSVHYVPSAWLAGPPFHIELRTLHVDRLRLDQELLKMAIDEGVTFGQDKVVRVEKDAVKISSVRTAGGLRISSPWLIDASGFGASILTREFNLPEIQYGPAKVALWTYFQISEAIEGTTLYMDPEPSEYLDWIWEIPVSPNTVSVGYVTTGASMKAQRARGLDIDDILRQQLMKFPRFGPLLRSGALSDTNVTSFRCRIHLGVAGTTWLIAGEAASMVDPITANGVTAALRHAAEASSLILKFRKPGKLRSFSRGFYSSRILQLAKFFNSGIERIVYEPSVRNHIGTRQAGTVYTSPAWTMNLVYARLRPRGVVSTLLFNSVIGLFRCSAWAFYQFCRKFKHASSTATSDGPVEV